MGKKRNKTPGPLVHADQPADTAQLLVDLRALIEVGRAHVARAVNAGMVLLYWSVGDRIRREILGKKRAAYGEEIVATVSAQLTAEYGRGYSRFALSRMDKFADLFPDRTIVAALSQQLGWSHFVEIIPLEDSPQREFYAEMCRQERWSVRTLRAKVQGMLFERTAIAKKPEEVARREIAAMRAEDCLTPDLVFRDPYVLDFLRLEGAYSEKDLEAAILRDLEEFILELGTDFAFVARQKRIVIDCRDFYIDLLFYHRRLHRLIAVDLKIGAFEAADKANGAVPALAGKAREAGCGKSSPRLDPLCGQVRGAGRAAAARQERHPHRFLPDGTAPRPLLEQNLHQAVRSARAKLECTLDSDKARSSQS